jgi:FOG: TPR repeat, SEL1 subfamily
MLQRGGIAACFLLLAGLCSAQQANEGDTVVRHLKGQAYRAYYGVNQPVNHALALQLYRQAAERGDAEAQFVTGGMLYQGQGTDPDKRGGFKWLLMAAEQGKTSPESLAVIGSMYLRGTLVPQNFLEAKRWLIGAAEQGNLAARNDLAYLYYNGLGGERDYKKALELYEKAAFQGDAIAQANTGMMYATGTGADTDKAKGYAWYSLAASRGNTSAVVNRNNLMMHMSWEELNRAQGLSLEFYRQVENMTEPKPIAPDPPAHPAR